MKNTRDAIRRLLERIVRRWSRFAWEEMLFDVGRVEWKFGRTDDGHPKNWTEWNNVRVHLRESGKLRKPQELESPNDQAGAEDGINKPKAANDQAMTPLGSAFIRECDTCKMITAIDIDPTPERWKEMCYYGQTIRTVSHEEAMRLWETSGRCKCTLNDKDQRPAANDL